MPGTPQPVGRVGDIPPVWVSVLQGIQNAQQQNAMLTAGAQQTNTLDQYGNTTVISGQLDQRVVIGASFGQPGVYVATNLTGAGLVTQQGLVTTTITTVKGNATATVASGAGMANGMVIGAANITDPTSGVATPAITPGTTIASGGGTTTVTLSAVAAESGSSLFCAACTWGPTPKPVAALPGSPIDGQDCYYLADATNGVVWHLKYRAASTSAYKWEFVGGSSMSSDVASGDSFSGVPASTWSDRTLCSVTVPLAGDYDIYWGGGAYFSNMGNANPVYTLGLSVAGAAPANTMDVGPGFNVPAGQQTWPRVSAMLKLAAVAASSVVKLQQQWAGAAVPVILDRYIRATPKRVG